MQKALSELEDHHDNKKTLCIIGGGIAGILSAKLAIDRGVNVVILEKNSQLKGIWSDYGYSWPGMSLNISKFNNSLCDFMWSDTDKIFPSREDFQNYIQAFINKYSIDKHAKLNTTVTKIQLASKTNSWENKFSVTYLVKNEEYTEIFDYVLIATGKFSKPIMLGLQKKFKDSHVDVIHSSAFRKPEDYKNKNVLVIGSSHSACQISAEICRSASSVTNMFRKPHWIIPYYVYTKKYNKLLPYDLVIFGNRQSLKNYSINKIHTSTTDAELNKVKNKFFSKFSTQNLTKSALNIDENSENSPAITISENYMKYYEDGLIVPIKAEVDSISLNQDKRSILIISEGETREIKVDSIIVCTGYYFDSSILDEHLDKLLIKQDSQQQKLNLDISSVFNSNLRNLAFIGMEIDLVVQTYPMQATLALNYFLDKNFSIESNPELFRMKFAKSEIFPYLDNLAICTGYAPDLVKIKEEDVDLYKMLMDGPIIPQHYGLFNYGSELYKKCAKYIKRFNEDLKNSK